MKFSKVTTIQFFIWVSALLWFYQIGFLQLWRSILLFQSLPFWFGACLFFFVFLALTTALLKVTATVSSEINQDYFYLTRKNIFHYIVLGIFTLIPWCLWVLPHLSRPPNTYGDEDFHFKATQEISNYFYSFFHGKVPETGPASASRYGGLMYLVFSLFTVWNQNFYFSPLLQRVSLLIPLLILSFLVFIFSKKILENSWLAFLFAIAICSSPLLLSFTMDKYLDIGQVPILFLVFASLYWGVSKQNLYALTLCGISASLAPLIRENVVPTTALISLFLGLYGTFVYPKRTVWSGLIAFMTMLPFLLFYFFKIHMTAIDADRLAFSNLFLQNYRSLFFMSWYYFNPLMIVLAVISFFNKNKETKLVVKVILVSLSGQLLIYALFDPTWMPWSRNYLMFYGQFVFLTLLGMVCLKKYVVHVKLLTLVLMSAILFNLWGDSHELNRNQFFHEIEIRFNYVKLFEYLNTHRDLPLNQTVYLQVPIALPYSFGYSLKLVEKKWDRPIAFSFQEVWKDNQFASFENMMSFKSFCRLIPSEAKYLLFHWWKPNTKIEAITRYPQVLKPNSSELASYKVLFESEDPLSSGRAGLILLEKR